MTSFKVLAVVCLSATCGKEPSKVKTLHFHKMFGFEALYGMMILIELIDSLHIFLYN